MHLPNEVHDLIISNLEPREHPNYRLIGHSFAQAAIPHVFRRIHASPMVSSLRDLAHIASQKHLSSHVTHLSWNSDQFRSDTNYHDSVELNASDENHSNDSDSDIGSSTVGSPGDDTVVIENEEAQIGFGEKQWEAVREILHRDANESEGHADIGMRILIRILSHFSNLKTLHIGIWDAHGPTERRLDPANPLSMIRGEYEMYTLLTAAHAAGCQITEFKLFTASKTYPLFRSDIWPSLVPVCKHLTSLDLLMSFALGIEEKERWIRESREMADARPEDERTEITTEFTTVYSDHSTAAQTALFQTFLSTLTNLRTLKLDFRAEQWDEDVDMGVYGKLRAPILEDVLPSNALPHLHTLELDRPSTSTAYLKALLTKNKEALEVVKLLNVTFAICGTESMYGSYENENEGCEVLKRWVELGFELDTWELTCLNGGCDLWPCCRAVGGIKYCC